MLSVIFSLIRILVDEDKVFCLPWVGNGVELSNRSAEKYISSVFL